METIAKLKKEIERREALASELEAKIQAAETKSGGLEDIREELSGKFYCDGDSTAKPKLDKLTEEGVRISHEVQNLGFALKTNNEKLDELREELETAELEVIGAERDATMVLIVELGAKIRARLGEVNELLDELSGHASRVERLNGKLKTEKSYTTSILNFAAINTVRDNLHKLETAFRSIGLGRNANTEKATETAQAVSK